MKTVALQFVRRCALVVGSFFFVNGVWAGGFLDLLARQNELETVTVTDFTPAGKSRPQPSPANPVYYVGVSAGYRDLGGIKAGEKAIPRQVVNDAMLKALAKHGYLPAAPGQQPDIFLAWTWGTLNAEHPSWLEFSRTRPINHGQMLRFLGGERHSLLREQDNPFPEYSLAPGLIFYGGAAESLYYLAMDDLYVAVVAAYAVEEVEGEAKPTLLWNTRISSQARGFYLPDALPAMLAIASSHIGRDTPKPVWIRATDKFKPEIKLGDPQLVEYLESGKVSLVEVGSSR